MGGPELASWLAEMRQAGSTGTSQTGPAAAAAAAEFASGLVRAGILWKGGSPRPRAALPGGAHPDPYVPRPCAAGWRQACSPTAAPVHPKGHSHRPVSALQFPARVQPAQDPTLGWPRGRFLRRNRRTHHGEAVTLPVAHKPACGSSERGLGMLQRAYRGSLARYMHSFRLASLQCSPVRSPSGHGFAIVLNAGNADEWV